MRWGLGLTLVEVIVVIAILGIFVAIAIPRLAGFNSIAEEGVCFDSVCPAGGIIYYSDGVVDCDVHGRGKILKLLLKKRLLEKFLGCDWVILTT